MKKFKEGNFIVGMLFAISLIPLGVYFFKFNNGLSNEPSVWAAFGSYIGGIYGALAFFIVIYSMHVTKSQFIEQSQDNIFYRSVEGLKISVQVYKSKLEDSFNTASFAKLFVDTIHEELANQSAHMARKILCYKPNLISPTNLNKIIYALNLKLVHYNKFNKKILLNEIEDRDSYESKWEYLKCIFGGLDNEPFEIRKALMDAGSVSFYQADFSHRKYYYDISWEVAEEKYSEEINIYLRKFDFILSHIVGSKNKVKYKKYLLSQLSKYDIILLYFLALRGKELELINTLFQLGLLDDIYRDECLFILFDCPSKEQVKLEINNINKMLAK